MSVRDKWERRYRDSEATFPAPCRVLAEFSHLLPTRGLALDLAAGLGGNALLLASHGLTTCAWDISATAMQKLDTLAREHQLAISTAQRDIISEPPGTASFDIIVISRFLHRPLCPKIIDALRPQGLLYYQTFTREKVHTNLGPSNPEYLLQPNELLQLFADLRVMAYREEGVVGTPTLGLRNEAWLVAQKA